MAHTPTVQPTWIYPTPQDGGLSTSPWTSTSPEPWSQQQLLTHNHVPTDFVHITVVIQFSVQHGPTIEQFLKALSQWHEAQAEQAFTGENPIRNYIESPAYMDHLKQFWDAITPTLYHHFLCRSPQCKLVVLNSHWLRTMAHGSTKQGSYLCPHCLETYRPFSNTSYNKNIGQLVQAKQCLVVKVPKDHPANAPLVGGQQLASDDQEYSYHCFLMEWPEKDTAPFLEQLKLITDNLLTGYQEAEDKVAYLHAQIHLRIRKTQKLPYMQRAAWTQHNIDEINERNSQSGTNKYKLQLLPQQWDSRLGKKTFYDYFPYKCDQTSTILSPADVTDLLALIYTQTFLQEYTRDISQTTKRRRANWAQNTRTALLPSHLVCEGDHDRHLSSSTFHILPGVPLPFYMWRGHRGNKHLTDTVDETTYSWWTMIITTNQTRHVDRY